MLVFVRLSLLCGISRFDQVIMKTLRLFCAFATKIYKKNAAIVFMMCIQLALSMYIQRIFTKLRTDVFHSTSFDTFLFLLKWDKSNFHLIRLSEGIFSAIH
jgi:hypothetical protein